MIKQVQLDNGVLTPITVDAIQGVASLQAALVAGVVKFGYRKKSDGSFRVAYGTRKPELIPKYKEAEVTAMLQAAKNVKAVYDNLIESPETNAENIKADLDAFKAHSENFEQCRKKLEPEAKDGVAKKATSNINYYDFEAGTFRSFDPETLEVIF